MSAIGVLAILIVAWPLLGWLANGLAGRAWSRGTAATLACAAVGASFITAWQALVMFRAYDGKTLGCVLVSSCLLASGQDTEVAVPVSSAALIAHMADKGVRVTIKADGNNRVAESNEANNTVSFNW